MPRPKKRPQHSIDVGAIPGILTELDSLLGAFDDEDPVDIAYRLDALTTMFLKARLVSHRRVGRVKFHVLIEEVALELTERGVLAQAMATFEDLINAYGDEPSEEEFDEAREILEKVVGALKAALQDHANKNQLRLDLN
jgi:hypothetical protein